MGRHRTMPCEVLGLSSWWRWWKMKSTVTSCGQQKILHSFKLEAADEGLGVAYDGTMPRYFHLDYVCSLLSPFLVHTLICNRCVQYVKMVSICYIHLMLTFNCSQHELWCAANIITAHAFFFSFVICWHISWPDVVGSVGRHIQFPVYSIFLQNKSLKTKYTFYYSNAKSSSNFVAKHDIKYTVY